MLSRFPRQHNRAEVKSGNQAHCDHNRLFDWLAFVPDFDFLPLAFAKRQISIR